MARAAPRPNPNLTHTLTHTHTLTLTHTHTLTLTRRAQSLAALGYVVLIADLLGDETGDEGTP